MCRMLLGVGTLPTHELIDGFVKMAGGKNERYTWHDRGIVIRHEHGWGWAMLDETGLSSMRFPKPVDERIRQLESRTPRALMLHARHATVGGHTVENTHPFLREQTAFCHNGTIWGDIPELIDREPEGTTDSERYFMLILDALLQPRPMEAITEAMKRLEQNWSANAYVLTKTHAYVISSFLEEDRTYPLTRSDGTVIDITIPPEYYRMRMAQLPDGLVISSERFGDLQWEDVPNDTLLRIDLATREITHHPLERTHT